MCTSIVPFSVGRCVLLMLKTFFSAAHWAIDRVRLSQYLYGEEGGIMVVLLNIRQLMLVLYLLFSSIYTVPMDLYGLLIGDSTHFTYTWIETPYKPRQRHNDAFQDMGLYDLYDKFCCWSRGMIPMFMSCKVIPFYFIYLLISFLVWKRPIPMPIYSRRPDGQFWNMCRVKNEAQILLWWMQTKERPRRQLRWTSALRQRWKVPS